MEPDETENGQSLIHPTPMAGSRYKTRSRPRFINAPKDNTNYDEMAELNLGLEMGTASSTRKAVFPSTWRLWKPSSTSQGQQRRREEALERYKDAQYQMVIKSRKMMDAFLEADRVKQLTAQQAEEDEKSMDISSSDTADAEFSASVPFEPAKQVDKLFSNALMLPEYFSDIPPDFALEWSCTPFPNGTRCIMIARDGNTQVRDLDGELLDEFQSVLPCGSSFTALASDAKFTLLDCIQVEIAAQAGHPSMLVYFALDMMAWGGKFYYNCNAESRFWMKSSWLSESEGLDTICKENKSGRNDRIILDLPRFDTDLYSLKLASTSPRKLSIASSTGCTIQPPLSPTSPGSISSTHNTVRINFENHTLEFEVEGLMFYFKDMDYIYEQTPVMCCLPIKHAQELLAKLSAAQPSETETSVVM